MIRIDPRSRKNGGAVFGDRNRMKRSLAPTITITAST
jgi:putative protein kinase ArgK-like GTPase of G3E family